MMAGTKGISLYLFPSRKVEREGKVGYTGRKGMSVEHHAPDRHSSRTQSVMSAGRGEVSTRDRQKGKAGRIVAMLEKEGTGVKKVPSPTG